MNGALALRLPGNWNLWNTINALQCARLILLQVGLCYHTSVPYTGFLPRDAMQARPMLSCGLCPPVTFGNSVETSNRIFKIFFTFGWPNCSSFSVSNFTAIFRRLTRRRMQVGYEQIAILGDRSMTAGRAISCSGRPCSLSHWRRRISESLFITACAAWTNTP